MKRYVIIERLVSFLRSVKVTDVIDIGIIALFIYLILIWFTRARAKFMFIGMLVLGGIYLLARFFGLYLTTMALQAFFAAALIMIVVIFQDDFRHFFENIAMLGRIRRRQLSASSSQNIDILSSALADLSRKKIGVLVAIRGIDPLDRHLEAGITLDGLLSQVLLESIFERHSPSHDGAVVIEGNKIVKFGAYLPLSANIKEVGRLGTRHAAALGLAERTDAFCLVVSEEDGTISVAEEGKVKHLKDFAQLQTVLESFYQKKFPRKKGKILTNFLKLHFAEKIIAFVIAASLWFIFGHRTELIRRDFIVPLEYRNLAPNVIIKEPKPKEITVTLSGSEQDFNLIKPDVLKLSLDMAGIQDGKTVFQLTKDLIGPIATLSVVNIEPGEIALDVHRMISLTIPIELLTKGKPSPGVVVSEIRIEPKEVAVTVPSTVPRDKFTITTEPVDLGPITETTTVVPALAVAPDIRFPGDKRPDVKVIIEVPRKVEAPTQEESKSEVAPGV
ncbi:MAG: diadenylate cyclase [Candidatus Omnitrophica bacterium]|nr:diadenylate cyclase [Candidatus Omnitrophota bacterium]